MRTGASLATILGVMAMFAAIIAVLIIVLGGGGERQSLISNTEGLDPVSFVFCVPLIERSPEGVQIAMIEQGKPVYKEGTCEPSISSDGEIAALLETGTEVGTKPTYVPFDLMSPSANFDQIVRTPGSVTIDGVQSSLTGNLIAEGRVVFDAIDRPILELTLTDEGRALFGEFTQSIVGLPLLIFVDGAPMRSTDGAVIAPIVAGSVDRVLYIEGLAAEDAARYASLASQGKLR